MFQDKYVFAQLTAFLNRTQFSNYVRKYDGNRYVKHLTCWKQLLAMMFGQLSNVLYDIEAQVPVFYTVTTASKNDSTAMSSIPYEPNCYYIFDRAYDTFKELFKIHLTGSY